MNMVVIAFYNRDQNISAMLLMHFGSPLLSTMSRLHIGGKKAYSDTCVYKHAHLCEVYVLYVPIYITVHMQQL